MDLLTNYFIALLATGAVHLSLTIFILLKGLKNRINQTYALYSVSIAIWAIFEAFGITSHDSNVALLLWRINHMGVIFIPIGFVHFVYCTTNISDWRKKLIPVSYALGFIFAIANCTKLMILEVVPKFSFRYFINPGAIYYVFFTIWLSWIVYGLVELFKAYFKSSGAKQNQLKYFCWSMLIAYIGGVPNFFPTFNIQIPYLMPYGTYAIPAYAFFTVYAIARYRLMDINVALTRTVIFIFVYIPVLVIPFSLAGWAKPWLMGKFGENWFWLPMFVLFALATAGPFAYLYLQRRAENTLLRKQRRYQTALLALAKRMTGLRCTSELFEATGAAIVDAVKPSYVGIYLMDEEHNSFKIQFSHPKKDKSRFEEFLPLDHPIIKILFERKKPLLTYEVPASIDRQGLYFSLIVPSFMEDQLLAFIVLGSKPNSGMYTEDDLLVFETLSYSMALSIENCFFWEDVEDRQRQARLEELDAFSYSVAHEIHNPMTVISGNADLLMKLLKKVNLTEEQFKDVAQFLNHIITYSDRVSKMVEAIHEFGKKTSGEFIPIDIRDVAETFSEAYAPQLKFQGIAFVKEIPDEPIMIRGEKGELLMVLNNFVKNSLHALQYTTEKKITLKVGKITSDRVRISFSDTGYGIEKEKLPIVFTQFVTTKASSEGSGMGLYVVKSVVSRHKGKIWAESEGKNRGATLILELPILKDVKVIKEKEDIKSRWKF